MARVGRLAGALLLSTFDRGEPAWFLVGDTKVPCDWDAAGFVRPADRDASVARFIRLVPSGDPHLVAPMIEIGIEGEVAARMVADRLLVARNGAVSERLWRLLLGEDEAATREVIDARWLGEMPTRVWDVVRDAVLKCT
jgi:precorrin-3B C17-methyltransferase